MYVVRICCNGSLSINTFHIRMKLLSDNRSRPVNNRLRFAHSGSILPPRRSLGSQVTRRRAFVTAVFASCTR